MAERVEEYSAMMEKRQSRDDAGRRVPGWRAFPTVLAYLQLVAPAMALIGAAVLWQSGASQGWSPAVGEWLRFTAAGGIVAFPVGAYLIVNGGLGLQRAAAAEHWPHVKGKVESVEIGQSYAGLGTTYHVPRVSYRYAVDGSEFVGDAIQSAPIACASEAQARAIAARYSVGVEVTVRYDPQSPWSAVLEIATVAARRRVLIGAGCLAAPIIFATLAAWHNSRL